MLSVEYRYALRHFLAHSKLCTIFLCLPEITLYPSAAIKLKLLFNTNEAAIIPYLLCFQCLSSCKDKCVPEVCVRKHSLYIQATKECRCRGSISSKQSRQPMDHVRGPRDTSSSEQLNADSSQCAQFEDYVCSILALIPPLTQSLGSISSSTVKLG